jgi:hypothetical protein
VGGNREVVCDESLGTIVSFGNTEHLANAVDSALKKVWDRKKIISYASANSWDSRVAVLLAEFKKLVA